MSSPAWYWHRLRAMTPAEWAAHSRRKVHQLSDSLLGPRRFARVGDVAAGTRFPKLPKPEAAPNALRSALQQDVAEIRAGRWMAFGYLPLQVEDPPRWHKDYLAGVDMSTGRRALKLHHRLEGEADIKLIWEPSRWFSLLRLAQGAYVLGDSQAAADCVRWLEDWADANPPYFGWHWTSGLESGIRLIQLAWIDALLTGSGVANFGGAKGNGPAATLARVRAKLLPPHLWFTWRDRSFGSSANNHILGELAGLIMALARWPNLQRWAAPLETLQPLWEEQVLAQFAPDGGNREQALNYHLFGWEFCWQTRLALRAAGRTVAPEVEDRLRAAASYFTNVQVENNAWDYGDSDSAFVTPLFVGWTTATPEWHAWLRDSASSPGIAYWIGESPKPLQPVSVSSPANGWRVYPESGHAVYRDADWFLRWDLSPLGYLSTAGHGHCDALHLSIWFRGRALVIDPGTGAYHSDRRVRDYLASWAAHNSPHPTRTTTPQRMGTFLWSAHHARPTWSKVSEGSLTAELTLSEGTMRRTVTRLPAANAWRVDDEFVRAADSASTNAEVLWQFAPDIQLRAMSKTSYEAVCAGRAVRVTINDHWTDAESWSPAPGDLNSSQSAAPRGLCSPAFRRVTPAPFLWIRGVGRGPEALQSTFRPE
jgi:hypothetical protein